MRLFECFSTHICEAFLSLCKTETVTECEDKQKHFHIGGLCGEIKSVYALLHGDLAQKNFSFQKLFC